MRSVGVCVRDIRAVKHDQWRYRRQWHAMYGMRGMDRRGDVRLAFVVYSIVERANGTTVVGFMIVQGRMVAPIRNIVLPFVGVDVDVAMIALAFVHHHVVRIVVVTDDESRSEFVRVGKGCDMIRPLSGKNFAHVFCLLRIVRCYTLRCWSSFFLK